MDDLYIDLLAASLSVPDGYVDGIDRQEAGNVMLALTGFRLVNTHARVTFNALLYDRARGRSKAFYQYMSILKTWATNDPYQRPWCLSPDEFKAALPKIVKGKTPDPAGEDWLSRNIVHAFALLTIVGAVTIFAPESVVGVAAGTAGRVLGAGVAGADLAKVATAGAAMASLERAYEAETRRRAYRSSI